MYPGKMHGILGRWVPRPAGGYTTSYTLAGPTDMVSTKPTGEETVMKVPVPVHANVPYSVPPYARVPPPPLQPRSGELESASHSAGPNFRDPPFMTLVALVPTLSGCPEWS